MFQLPSIELIARARALELEEACAALLEGERVKRLEKKGRVLGLHVNVRIMLQPRISVAVTTSRAQARG
jgi:hypothetical protein